jgi:hypothetical protein
MSKEQRKVVVLKEKGFLTQVNPNEVESTDKILFEGSPSDCEAVIHGGKKK